MRDRNVPEAILATVVKVGGSVMADAAVLDAVLAVIAERAHGRRLLVVPGGGVFADAVREVDRRIGLSSDAAHWMAVQGMDQSAHIVTGRLPNAVRVADASEISRACSSGRIPVLAPSHWLQAADPLPHTWDVTGDSIAAWVAGRVGATHLVLIKPRGVAHCRSGESGAPGLGLVDAWFPRAVPEGVRWTIVPADQVELAFEAQLTPE